MSNLVDTVLLIRKTIESFLSLIVFTELFKTGAESSKLGSTTARMTKIIHSVTGLPNSTEQNGSI